MILPTRPWTLFFSNLLDVEEYIQQFRSKTAPSILQDYHVATIVVLERYRALTDAATRGRGVQDAFNRANDAWTALQSTLENVPGWAFKHMVSAGCFLVGIT